MEEDSAGIKSQEPFPESTEKPSGKGIATISIPTSSKTPGLKKKTKYSKSVTFGLDTSGNTSPGSSQEGQSIKSDPEYKKQSSEVKMSSIGKN